jgi:hypothetical protein
MSNHNYNNTSKEREIMRILNEIDYILQHNDCKSSKELRKLLRNIEYKKGKRLGDHPKGKELINKKITMLKKSNYY